MRTALDIFAQIFRNLWAHKLRSFLTMFGIAWGVGSLLLLVGVGEGFRSGNKRELAEFRQGHHVSVSGACAGGQGQHEFRAFLPAHVSGLPGYQASWHTSAMLARIISRSDLHEVSEFASGSGEILGTEPQLNEISYLPLKEGRWLNELDGVQRRNVIVLGKRVAEDAVSRASRGWRVRPAEWHPI